MSDRKTYDKLKNAKRGSDRNNVYEESRDKGFLVFFAKTFGTEATVPAGKLNIKIDDPEILVRYDVGKIEANRNLSDVDVMGSRLPSRRWIELVPAECAVKLTVQGVEIAEKELAEMSALKETGEI